MPTRKASFVSYQGSRTAIGSFREAVSVSGKYYFVSVVCMLGMHGSHVLKQVNIMIKVSNRQGTCEAQG